MQEGLSLIHGCELRHGPLEHFLDRGLLRNVSNVRIT